MDFSLLKDLQAIHAPAGNEAPLRDFVIDYVEKNKANWKVQPDLVYGDGFQDCLILRFGNPRTAIFAHMDSIGFTVRYGKELIKLGGPRLISGTQLVGEDSKGAIETELVVNEDNTKTSYKLNREIDRGTNLTFKPNWRDDGDYIQNCYMDNRLGMWNALKVAETLEDGVIVFSCWEETGGGSVGYLGKYIYEKWGVRQALISDITWVTEGIPHGEGVAISMRDSGIPRKSYVRKIIDIATRNKIKFQLEVEDSGGSDGNGLQKSSYPFDWCFIGAPEDHVHTPDEKVHKGDVAEMVKLYEVLMKEL
ncbi:MAG: aminopeptidase [Flavobacteriales bacterium]|nr:aminopeptidase [Flavobacteriales bacterium]